MAGALSFAIFYYRAYDWSVATNDPYLLRQVSLSTCTACQGIISRLDDLAAKKEVVRGGRITLDSADVVSGHFRYRSDYVVEIKIKQDAATIQESGQTPRQVAAATTDDALVFVSWIGDGWRIVEVAKPS